MIGMEDVRALGSELSNWGRWGPDDELGTANLVTPAKTAAATRLVRRGVSFSLALPMDENGPWDPRSVAGRFNPIHRMTRYRGDNARGEPWGYFSSSDDMIVMGLQSSTQFDALAHLWYDDKLYNGFASNEAVTAWGAKRCSIQKLIRGIVTRGILADVAAHQGVDVLPPAFAITPALLDSVLGSRTIEPQPGDVLLVRTGVGLAHRRREPQEGGSPGLTVECTRWLSEHDIAAVCSDNMTVEVTGTNGDGPLMPFHMVALRDMGLLLGELFDLEDLAADCARDGVFEFLFVGAPLNIPGAVGSPLNPLAVK